MESHTIFMSQKTQHNIDTFKGKGTGIAKKEGEVGEITLVNFKVVKLQ